MKDSFIKKIIFLTIASLLIIPFMSIKMKLNTNSEYKTLQEFKASYLLFDIYEKASHGIDVPNSDSITWNPKYFKDFSGRINYNYTNENIMDFECQVNWPKSKTNYIEKASFFIEGKRYEYNDFKGVLYE